MKDHRHLGTKTGKFRVKKWLLFFIHKNLPESVGIFYGVVAAVTDVFFHRVGTVAGGKGGIHQRPVFPVKFYDIVYPTSSRYTLIQA